MHTHKHTVKQTSEANVTKTQQDRNASVDKGSPLMHLVKNFCWVNTSNFKGPYNLQFLMQLCSKAPNKIDKIITVSRTPCHWSAKQIALSPNHVIGHNVYKSIYKWLTYSYQY